MGREELLKRLRLQLESVREQPALQCMELWLLNKIRKLEEMQ